MNINTDKTKKTPKDKTSNWLRNIAVGLLLFISGLLSKFYPATILTIVYIVTGLVLALIGISDCVAALKYKETGSDWKLVVGMGAVSILAAVYFIPAVIYLYAIQTSIYIFASWLIIRGILNIAGIIRKTLKRKNLIVWALVTILAGILLIAFCDKIVSYASEYLAYVLLAAGAVLTFYGIYQKTDEKETKEKALREEAIRTGLDQAVNTAKQTPEYNTEPKAIPEVVTPSEPVMEETQEKTSQPVADTAEDITAGVIPEETPAPTSEEPTQPAAEDVVEVDAVEITNKEDYAKEKKGFFSSLFRK